MNAKLGFGHVGLEVPKRQLNKDLKLSRVDWVDDEDGNGREAMDGGRAPKEHAQKSKRKEDRTEC